MSGRRKLVVVLSVALLGLISCQSGLATDEGHPYKCGFDVTSADQCAPGWTCAVDNTCHKTVEDKLPETRPSFGPSATLVYPQTLKQGVKFAVAGTTVNPVAPIFVVTDDGLAFLADRSSVKSPPGAVTLPSDLDEAAYSGGLLGTIHGGAVTVTNPFAQNDSQQVNLPLQSKPTALRAGADLTDSILYLLRRGATAGEIDVGRVGGRIVAAVFSPFNLPALADGGFNVAADVRPVKRKELEFANQRACPDLPDGGPSLSQDPAGNAFLPVAVSAEGIYYRHCKEFFAANDVWAPLTPASDPLDLPIVRPDGGSGLPPPIWRIDRSNTIFALAYPPESIISNDQPRALTVLQLHRSPTESPSLSRAWGDCRPCAQGDRIVELAPTIKNGGAAVEVLCEHRTSPTDGGPDATTLSLRRVTGAAGSGVDDPCEFDTATASIDLTEINRSQVGQLFHYAINDAVSDGLVVGGAHGQLWRGEAFTTLQPLYLDRVPDQVSMLGGQPFALLRDFVAAPSDGGVFTIISPQELTGENKEDPIFPRSAPTDVNDALSGWVVLSTSDLAKVFPHADGGQLGFSASYGSQLVDSAGAPAAEPYFLQAADYDRNNTAGVRAKHFIVTANDGLFESTRETTPDPRQLPQLTPVLTPQPGATIRSMILDTSVLPNGTNDVDNGESGPLVSGYLIAGRNLYAFRKQQSRWSIDSLPVAAGEPMEVWMKSPNDSLGRVGFRDGTVLTLPQGFKLVVTCNNDVAHCGTEKPTASRAVDFANLGGVPVLLATDGVYVASDEQEGSVLHWKRQQLPPELTSTDGGTVKDLEMAKLVVTPEGSDDVLYLYTDHGFVYRLARVTRQ